MSRSLICSGNRMGKHVWIFVACCVVIGLIFLSFATLPSFANTLAVENIKPLHILIGLFYSIMLSHPYLRTTQLISNPSLVSEERTFSAFQQKGMVLEYLISRVGYLLIGIVVAWMALTSLFRIMSILHYLLIPLYGLSIVLLELVNEKVVLSKKSETAN
jgi:hypothetical protein